MNLNILLLITIYSSTSTCNSAKVPDKETIEEYCKLDCGDTEKKKNTVCEFKCELAPECMKFAHRELTTKDRQFVADLHNSLKNEVALGQNAKGVNKTGSNMMVYSYDAELEIATLCWGRRCTFKHDACRSTKKLMYNGQNIYQLREDPSWSGTNKGLLDLAIRDWYGESNLVSEDILLKYTPSTTASRYGHYTQIIWCTASTVGCQLITFMTEDGYKNYFVLCNYGPTGNIIGPAVYKFGEPGSDCPPPHNQNKKYKGLCGLDEAVLDVPDDSENSYASPLRFSYGLSLPLCLLPKFLC